MKICYLYIKKYKNLEDIGITLDSHYIFELDKSKKVLSISDNPRHIDGFYGENIYSLAVIAGKNGVGKTNFLRFLLTAVVDGMNDKTDLVGIVVYKNGDTLICSPKDSDITVLHNGNPVQKLPHKSCRAFFYTSHPIHGIWNWDILTKELTGLYNASDSARFVLDYENYVNDGQAFMAQSYDNYLLAHLSQRSFKLLLFLADYYRNGSKVEGLTIPLYILLRPNYSGRYKSPYQSDIAQNGKIYDNSIRSWSQRKFGTLYEFFITSLLNKASNNNEYKSWQPLIDGWIEKVKNSQEDDVIKLWQEWMVGKIYQSVLERILFVVTAINEKCQYNDVAGAFYFNLRNNLDGLDEFVKATYQTKEFLAARYFDVSLSYDKATEASLSSGEEKLLYLMAEIYYSHYVHEKKFSNINAPTLYILDEAEMGLHPEWQRLFVSYLAAFFDYFQHKDIQIVLTTHSPILLSDTLRQNVVLLDKIDEHTTVVEHQETFGTNIFELYRDSFFLKDGLMGKLAVKKIEEIVKDIENRSNVDNLALRISMIGDPQIRNYLTLKYAAIDQNRAISLLEKQIEQIRLGNYGND